MNRRLPTPFKIGPEFTGATGAGGVADAGGRDGSGDWSGSRSSRGVFGFGTMQIFHLLREHREQDHRFVVSRQAFFCALLAVLFQTRCRANPPADR
jgi:hypothetical protein